MKKKRYNRNELHLLARQFVMKRIEGFEVEVFQGMKNIFKNFKR